MNSENTAPKKTQLEVGDKIIRYRNNRMTVETVARVTKTMAITGGPGSPRIRREIGYNGFLNEVGGDVWSRSSFRVWTAELEEEHNKRQAEKEAEQEFNREWNTIQFDRLPIEIKKEIYALVLMHQAKESDPQ